jgi:cob(I)alamin adenosyltransferase
VRLETERPSATNPEIRRYLNRLSDLIFCMARREAGEAEPASR